MATTLTSSGEITTQYFSFPITKTETTEDGDLLVYGRATDGSVDHDQQIVDPAFSSKAIAEWLRTGGNIRVQHSPQRDPAGIGVEANTDAEGATWVKGLIVEPIAKKLVAKGVLRAYSVGIASPTIERDVTGKARGGIIKSGKIVEISLVDRPANASCGFQLVKSAGDGEAEYVGKVFGEEGAIAKALGADITKNDIQDAINQTSQPLVPGDISIDFTPNDLMRLLQEKMAKRYNAEQAEKRDFDRGVGGGVDRDKLPESDFAGPHRSFPIVTQSDVSDALHLVGHADDPAAVRARIHEIARRKGFSVPDGDSSKAVEPEVTADETAGKTDTPDIIKDPMKGPDVAGPNPATPGKNVPPKPSNDDDDDEVEDEATGKAAKPKKKGKKLPPWLNKPADGDDDDSKAEKCHVDPKTASGAEEPHDMEPAPLGELQEYPAKPHMKSDAQTQAIMRFKTLGVDAELGMLHDMTCPAFHPDEVAKSYPFADFSTLINEELWQRRALAAAAGKSISEAIEAQQAWQAVALLKSADPGDLNDYRLQLHKAFRDANPGPMSFPTPCEISPKKFNRPCITDGHAGLSSGYGSPNSSPSVASSAPNAHSFDRPPLGSGHQSPSPSHMKASFEYPSEQGVPTSINYGMLEKEKARRALSTLHDHLNHMFPSSCPMLDQDPYQQERPVPVVPTVGVGKAAEPEADGEVLGDVYKIIRKLEKKVRRGELTEAQARNELSRKTAKRYAQSLTKQVQKGLTSTNEVLKALGLPVQEAPAFAQPVSRAEPAAANSLAGVPDMGSAQPDVAKGITPDIFKTMMSELLEPFQAKIDSQEKNFTEYRQQSEAREAELQKELGEHRKRWEALANQPDPSTAPFTGLAINPMHNSPAGIVKRAEASERSQNMIARQLERTWRTSENPTEREAAYNALCKLKGMND